MAPVRVVHVIHDLRVGGTERRLLAVLGGLDRSQFEPLLVCVNGTGPLEEEARALGLEPHVVGRNGRFDLSGVFRLARLLRRERIGIVHGWLSLANGYGRVAGAIARVGVLIASEGGAVTTTNPWKARRDALIERMLTPLTDAYVANSEAVAASLRAMGIPVRKITVIPNGVARLKPLGDEARAQLRAELGASPHEQLVGMVARLDADFKDHESFLAAIAELVSEGRHIRGVLVGDGEARPALERRVVELGLGDRVRFTGYRADATSVLRVLDVSVLLTRSEGFSNVLLESMAAGVPLVTTAISPNREAVEDGVNGLLVPVGDPTAAAAALRRLLDDPQLATRVAHDSRARVAERYSLAAQAEKTMQLYRQLLEKNER